MSDLKNKIKAVQHAVGVKADGIAGPVTLKAICWEFGVKSDGLSTEREYVVAVQKRLGLKADGIAGAKTWTALCNSFGVEPTASGTDWPTQAEVRTGKSIFGKAGDESNLVSITPPYTLYYDGKAVKTIRVHKLVADAVLGALQEVLDMYGAEKIHELGLDRYDGAFNNRSTTTGAKKSMHAWGIALDFDAGRNAYATRKPKAALSRPECIRWWEAWEKRGGVSLGRERDCDWMHIQFAKL